MRRLGTLLILPAVMAGLACADQSATDSALSEELARDLAMTSSTGLELAGNRGPEQVVVSAIEAPVASAPRRAPAPAPSPVQRPVPQPAPVAAPAEAPAPVYEPVVAVARPTAMDVSYPSRGSGASGSGERNGGSGGVVVVIRGGSGGMDPCPPPGGRTTIPSPSPAPRGIPGTTVRPPFPINPQTGG